MTVDTTERGAARIYDQMLVVQLRKYAEYVADDSNFRGLWAVLTQAAERLEKCDAITMELLAVIDELDPPHSDDYLDDDDEDWDTADEPEAGEDDGGYHWEHDEARWDTHNDDDPDEDESEDE